MVERRLSGISDIQHSALTGELGKRVWDAASCRVGILMDVLEYAVSPSEGASGVSSPSPRAGVAFVRPERGGREWEVRADAVTVLGERVPEALTDGERVVGGAVDGAATASGERRRVRGVDA